jgi:hypothetical protein
MKMAQSLQELGLNSENSVIIGSGILSAYGIRASNDIDVVVNKETYNKLTTDNRFTKAENHGREILTDELFEIGTSWGVLGKNLTFNDLLKQSIVVNGVRYINLDFLLAVKQSWLNDKDIRQKDIDDVKLINTYLANQVD